MLAGEGVAISPVGPFPLDPSSFLSGERDKDTDAVKFLAISLAEGGAGRLPSVHLEHNLKAKFFKNYRRQKIQVAEWSALPSGTRGDSGSIPADIKQF